MSEPETLDDLVKQFGSEPIYEALKYQAHEEIKYSVQWLHEHIPDLSKKIFFKGAMREFVPPYYLVVDCIKQLQAIDKAWRNIEKVEEALAELKRVSTEINDGYETLSQESGEITNG